MQFFSDKSIMAVDSNQSSLIWDSSSSPIQFHSSSLSTIPDHFHRTMVAPLALSQRKRHSHAGILQLPQLKLRSTMTWNSSEEEGEQKFHSSSFNSAEREAILFKQKYSRLRASLSVRVSFRLVLFCLHTDISILRLGSLGKGRSSFDIAWLLLLDRFSFYRPSNISLFIPSFLWKFPPIIQCIFLFQQSVQQNRHMCDKVLYKKSTIQQTIDEHDALINQLTMVNNELMGKVRRTFPCVFFLMIISFRSPNPEIN